MLFSSPIFLLLFLPLLLAAYFVLPRRFRNILLLCASLAFYAYGERVYVVLMLFSIAFNYLAGLAIGRVSGASGRSAIITIGIAGNLALLIVFKYANFIVDSLNAVTAGLGVAPLVINEVHLPIGISFFTFQAISYIVDIYRGDAQVQRNPVKMGLYISLFPQLIAGPIVRYQHIAAQLATRVTTLGDFSYGVKRFTYGLGKKMIIANTVALPVDQIFALPDSEITTTLAWFAVFCYFLQIYFDFSGYSDMAIGLGRMFGFRFLENFNFPYISKSMTEFWRRWHISLSTWFRDYLYVPLGGNRISRSRTYCNLLLVFFLCGLWHGASWNFVAWGLFHGLFLIGERCTRGITRVKWIPAPIAHAYVLLAVVVSWVPFRAETFSQATTFLGAMFGWGSSQDSVRLVIHYCSPEIVIACLIGIAGATPIFPTIVCAYSRWLKKAAPNVALELLGPTANVIAVAGILFYSIMLMAAGSYNPFIYFRF